MDDTAYNTVDYMVIVAHPDDAEFGCAGSVAGWVKDNKRVVYVICTSGDKGSSDPEVLPKELAQKREEEQIQAASVVGVEQTVFLGYPDQGLEDTAQFRKDIVRQMRIYRPRVVVTMDPYRKYIWHRDHRICGQVTLDAVYPFVRDPLAYPDLMNEGIHPHKVSEIWFFGTEDINIQIDITEDFDKKIEALYCHVCQMESMGREKVRAWVRKKCEDMARGTDFQYAEGFHRVIIPS